MPDIEQPAPEKPAPKSKKRGSKTSEDASCNTSKKAKTRKNTNMLPKPVEEKLAAPETSRRKILPSQQRDTHPGSVDQPAPRQSAAQVKRDQEYHAKLLQSIDELMKRRNEMLAEYELAQERDELNEEHTLIQSLEDLIENGDMEDLQRDTMTNVEANDPMLVDAEWDPETRGPVVLEEVNSPEHKKKPGRGEVKAGIDARKAALRLKPQR
ncbi:hypothetical protein H0H81_006903 [Sphagnurus paluster]|uniref:Uncharacterized protein n=1 Tax=Sphagnurus paluster TaxID=117069 RepID=A0A9P7K1X7_9AGAR|nr:hypothetical protein H0H81_006903 [Sphagnurus paluster]